jgi:hypothetical protein
MLIDHIGDLPLPKRESHLDEIITYQKDDFKIANRDDDIDGLLKNLAFSRYVNFVIIGDEGIGKSMGLKHVIKLITGEVELDPKHKHFDYVQRIRKRAEQFQRRDYLFLPNLQDPFNPVALDYVNGEIEEAELQTKDFCTDVINFFQQSYLEDKVQLSFNQKEFQQYVTSAVRDVYARLYATLGYIVDAPAKFSVMPSRTLKNFRFSVDFLNEKDVNYQSLRKTLNWMRSGWGAAKTSRDKNRIQSRLKSSLRYQIKPKLNDLYRDISDIAVDGLDLGGKRKLFLKTFADITKEYGEISDYYNQDIELYYSKLAKSQNTKKVNLKLSEKSVDWCVDSLEKIVDTYKDKTDEKVFTWMRSVSRYFASNRKHMSRYIVNYYQSMRDGENVFRRPIDVKDLRDSHTLKYHTNSNDPEDFIMTHAKRAYTIKEVLSPHKYVQSSKNGQMGIKEPDSMTNDSLLGTVQKPDNDRPPHKCYDPGYLVDSSILYVPDDIGALFKAILSEEKHESESRRQGLLSYCEDGELIVKGEGLTFRMYAPAMILGCANDWPFVKNHTFKEDEFDLDYAMASRFVISYWDSSIPNTAEARKGSIKVINNRIEGFNEQNQTGVSVDPEVVDWLLSHGSTRNTLSLKYRQLTKEIDRLMEFAKSKSVENITIDDVKRFNLSEEPKNRFHWVNRSFDDVFAVREFPTETTGAIFGTALTCMDEPVVFPLRSKIIPDRAASPDSKFQSYDIGAELTDKTAVKGYNEAVDFLRTQLAPDNQNNFMVKTTFHREHGAAGDSASLASALSLFSELSDIPIQQNRFCTGTLSFHDGTVGPIGGVDTKSLAVLKWHELKKEKGIAGKDGKSYFFFPAQNFETLEEYVRTSPYDYGDNVVLIPISNFAQALYLATVQDITPDDIEHLPERSEAFYLKSKRRMNERVAGFNKQLVASTVPEDPLSISYA